jgi:hypothetical protein
MAATTNNNRDSTIPDRWDPVAELETLHQRLGGYLDLWRTGPLGATPRCGPRVARNGDKATPPAGRRHAGLTTTCRTPRCLRPSRGLHLRHRALRVVRQRALHLTIPPSAISHRDVWCG